ncbi:hypothetical protein FOZ63_012527, partial [Perkinsus olseni]
NIGSYGRNTFDNERFVQFNHEAEGLAVFTADECIRRWDEVETFFIDSFFFIIQHGFAQTLAVTGAIDNQFMQPAYALLSGMSGFAEFCMKKKRTMQAQGSNGLIHLKS